MKTRLLLVILTVSTLSASLTGCNTMTPEERTALLNLGTRVVENRLLKPDSGK